MGWQPLADADHMQMVAAWLEVLHVTGVPIEQFDACFRAARHTQIERRARGEDVLPLSADDLAVEWVQLRNMHAEIDKTPLLPERARGCCSRCFGTGFARMPDGSVQQGCKHEEWTPEDESELEVNEERQREEVRRQAEFMRDALSKIGQPRPEPSPAQVARPKGDTLKCDNPKCGREVDTYFLRFEPGDACRDLLNRYTSDEGAPELCRGKFMKIPAAG